MRALLSPVNRKHRSGRAGKRRRTPYEIEDAGRWTLIDTPVEEVPVIDDADLERLIEIYLARWGVISRKVLEKEQAAPSWRTLLLKLRRMELQGRIRGGRFIAGIGGEQFALPETVKALRTCARDLQEQPEHVMTRRVINATDPLNLVGVIMPGRKIPSLAKNRILFENGLPVAVLEKDAVSLLRPCLDTEREVYQQVLRETHYPARLRAYL